MGQYGFKTGTLGYFSLRTQRGRERKMREMGVGGGLSGVSCASCTLKQRKESKGSCLTSTTYRRLCNSAGRKRDQASSKARCEGLVGFNRGCRSPGSIGPGCL